MVRYTFGMNKSEKKKNVQEHNLFQAFKKIDKIVEDALCHK